MLPELLLNLFIVPEAFAHQSESKMSVQIVMDGSGDTRYEFDATDPSSLAAAEARFRELTGRGFRAVTFNGERQPGNLINEFDPAVDRTLFIPRLQGG
jgi:hypothetical protein